ncbi:chemotaxis protein CheB [Sphingomonas endolithica]|uniref:chemotaxis protein CheB n=1 Tax=Sphingomonas endolithica TaxID=2972485 RepID=UPI0021AE7DD6|nr:chemotaxis protein CheB [Sphingomonas sp. ZFBP2030]
MSIQPISTGASAPSASGTRPAILIVDDSAVARAVIGRAIEGSGRFVLAGAVQSVTAAIEFLRHRHVDAILLDIEMPGIDGLSALPDLLAASDQAKILIVSSTCREGALTTVQALALGAADTLIKPGGGAFAGRFAQVLIDKISRLFEVQAPLPEPAPTAPASIAVSGFDIVAIGASTGGIHALSQLFQHIPPAFPLPMLITQHLPTSFMPYFAAQIAVLAGRPCDIAVDRLRIRPGRVIIAPGDAHLRVVSLGGGEASIRLTHEAVRSGCMPSVDPMFESLAEVYGSRALAVVLSGMGSDGSDGARHIVEAGGSVIVQDKASSVVWGMPGTIAGAGRASAILPPEQIGQLIATRQRPS